MTRRRRREALRITGTAAPAAYVPSPGPLWQNGTCHLLFLPLFLAELIVQWNRYTEQMHSSMTYYKVNTYKVTTWSRNKSPLCSPSLEFLPLLLPPPEAATLSNIQGSQGLAFHLQSPRRPPQTPVLVAFSIKLHRLPGSFPPYPDSHLNCTEGVVACCLPELLH